MSKTLTITVPDRVYRALECRGRWYEMTAAEFLKQHVIASEMGSGAALNLHAVGSERTPLGEVLRDQDLLLFGVPGVDQEEGDGVTDHKA